MRPMLILPACPVVLIGPLTPTTHSLHLHPAGPVLARAPVLPPFLLQLLAKVRRHLAAIYMADLSSRKVFLSGL